MNGDIRLVHINCHLREFIQNSSAQFRIDLHGLHGESFMGTACVYLERLLLSAIHFSYVRHYMGRQFFKTFPLHDNDRADSYNSEYSLQCSHCFLIIKFTLCLYIDSSFFLGDAEKAFHILQHLSDPVCKGILEHITILSLDADLSIFNQKCFICHGSLLYFLVNFLRNGMISFIFSTA